VVQHRPADLPALLDRTLGKRTVLRVKEAEDGEPLVVGTVFVAPADRHLLIDSDGSLARPSQES
jgi:two-component system chemotaxis response regulator CheB